jgi:N-succinyldiaminopimelate aminotransferase
VGRHPSLSNAAESLPLSIFASLYQRLARYQGHVVPFHIGDTHLAPPQGARLAALGFTDLHDPELYAYAPPSGHPRLIERVVEKIRNRNGMPVTPDGVQVTCGATHALSCAVRALLDPGEEILLLAPHWPLIRGIAIAHGVRPVEVPFSHRLLREPGLDPAALIEPYLTPRTGAIYLCTPNNPDGMVFTPEMLATISHVAAKHDLWVLSDEVYEDYVYDGTHRSIGALPGMHERTITVYSFSKSHAMAGLRIGYCVGSRAAIAAVRKMANHSVYNVPQALQRAALAALEGGELFLADARVAYRKARDYAAASVAAPTMVPQGSTYLFLDLNQWSAPCPGEAARDCSDAAGCWRVLERLADEGVLLAPGAAFGARYAGWARLCYTSVDFERLGEGIARLNRVLAEASGG